MPEYLDRSDRSFYEEKLSSWRCVCDLMSDTAEISFVEEPSMGIPGDWTPKEVLYNSLSPLDETE